MELKRISVIGLGYIGLPTAALLSNKGYYVSGIDLNPEIVETVNRGQVHIVEPDLDFYVKKSVDIGTLKAFNQPQPSDIYLICVPTPLKHEAEIPIPDLDYVFSAINSISNLLKAGDLLILESTSPVGTTHLIQKILESSGINASEIHIAYCPERVLPGRIISELTNNSRIIGGLTSESTRIVANFYRTFVKGEVLETDAKTAEMCKLIENSFRDINIAFANEISILCHKEGINTTELIDLANKHPRVNILEPGAGVGGHCIAVDPWFLVSSHPRDTSLIKTAREVNMSKTMWVIEQIKNLYDVVYQKNKQKPTIACLGLTFKPNIDDLRESPAVTIVDSLRKMGYEVCVVEPNIDLHPNFNIVTLEDAYLKADIFIALVKHKEFMKNDVIEKLSIKHTLDFCGITQLTSVGT